MENQNLYKSVKGRSDIIKLYDEKLAALNIVYDSLQVPTSFGETHVIITGDARKPPLIVLHGSNGSAPIALETYPKLAEKYQVFAIDVIAQPNRSSMQRPSMKDNSYGQWCTEIIEYLQLKDVVLAGFSFGGLIILKTLLYKQSNIKEVFLAAPVFIVNGNPLTPLFKVFLPMRKYMRTQNISYVKRFLSNLFTERDVYAERYLAKVFLEFKMDFSPLPTITKKEAQSIETPITLFGAENDILFPGKKMLRRAQKIFPSLKHFALLENSKHVQGKKHNEHIQNIILK